jgi:hypothetical protein
LPSFCSACRPPPWPRPSWTRSRSTTAKKKEDVHRGVVQQDSVAGLVCRVGTTPKTVTFAAADVIDVRHGLRGGIRLVYDRGRVADVAMDTAASEEDRVKHAQEAVKKYQEVLKEKDVEESKSIQRHLQYRTRVYAKLAEDNAEQRDAAIAALDKFVKTHNDCWQFRLPCDNWDSCRRTRAT